MLGGFVIIMVMKKSIIGILIFVFTILLTALLLFFRYLAYVYFIPLPSNLFLFGAEWAVPMESQMHILVFYVISYFIFSWVIVYSIYKFIQVSKKMKGKKF